MDHPRAAPPVGPVGVRINRHPPARLERVGGAGAPAAPGAGVQTTSADTVAQSASSGSSDLFGIGAAVQSGLFGIEAGAQVLLGAALITVGLLILMAQTGAGGSLARGVSRGAARAGRKAVGAVVGGPAGAVMA